MPLPLLLIAAAPALTGLEIGLISSVATAGGGALMTAMYYMYHWLKPKPKQDLEHSVAPLVAVREELIKAQQDVFQKQLSQFGLFESSSRQVNKAQELQVHIQEVIQGLNGRVDGMQQEKNVISAELKDLFHSMGHDQAFMEALETKLKTFVIQKQGNELTPKAEYAFIKDILSLKDIRTFPAPGELI